MNISSTIPPLTMRIRISGLTDQGMVRDHNEDDYRIAFDLTQTSWGHSPEEGVLLGSKGALMVVADGMGGAAAGEVASRIAVEEVKSYFNHLQLPDILRRDDIYRILERAFFKVHEVLLHETSKNDDLSGMGTTLTIGWFISNQLYVAWVGDSRAYLYNRNGIDKTQEPKYRYCTENLKILTDDHSLVWERVIQSEGKYTPEDARLAPDSNVILRCLGHDFDFSPPQCIGPFDLRTGDQVLLCTDGLNGMISDVAIDHLLSSGESGSDLCFRLIQTANHAGGKDNITVILADILDIGQTQSKTGSPESQKFTFIQNNSVKVNSKRDKVKYRWILFFIVMNILAVSGFIYFYLNQNKISNSSIIGMDNLKRIDSIPSDALDSVPSNLRSTPRKMQRSEGNIKTNPFDSNTKSDDLKTKDNANEVDPPSTSTPNPTAVPNPELRTTKKPKIESKKQESKFKNSKVAEYTPSAKCEVDSTVQSKKSKVNRESNGISNALYKPLDSSNGEQYFACNEADIELDLGNIFNVSMIIWYKKTNKYSNEIFIEKIELDGKEVDKVRGKLKAN